jgi:uncharacterized membrane protein YfcA
MTDPATLALGAVGALLVGLSKSGVPGLGIVAVPLMAMAFPTRVSVAALLPLLIVGDVFAIAYYHRHAQWRKLWGLFPWVAAGFALGVWMLARVDDRGLRPFLGGLVLALLALEQVRARLGWNGLPNHPAFVAFTGAAAGFATMVGNAAGPIMTLYLMSRDLDKEQFIGTSAWFFFLVNSSKVPVYLALGMMTRGSLTFDAALAPLVAAGALVGVRLLPRLSRRAFYDVALLLAAAAALRLLWP